MPYRRVYRSRRRLQQKRTLPYMMATTARTIGTGATAAYGAVKSYKALKNAYKQNKSRSRTLTKTLRKNVSSDVGGYSQHTIKNRKTYLSKKISLVKQLGRNARASEEKIVYRWNGVKEFNDHGYYWLNNYISGDRRYMPCYSFDLTSCINSDGTSAIVPQPMSQLYSIAGQVGFEAQNNLASDGVTVTPNLQLERAPGSSLSIVAPHNHSIMKWMSLKLNLWGCKNRSTRFLIQLVSFKDDNLLPHHITGANDNRSALFQSIIKPFTFNPVSTTGSQLRKYMKVLRSETFIIQPTSTTETDQDPHIKTLNWFIRLNRLVDYAVKQNILTSNVDVADQADFNIVQGQQNDCYANPSNRLYLMVYASNYGADATQSNADTPSFDLSARMCHIHSA